MTKSGEQQGKKKAAKALKPSTENSKKKKKKKEQEETISEAQECNGESDPEDAFWMPPVGQRWDNDNGGDRWGSGSDSEHESDKIIAMGMFVNFANLTLYLCLHFHLSQKRAKVEM